MSDNDQAVITHFKSGQKWTENNRDALNQGSQTQSGSRDSKKCLAGRI